MVGRVEVWRIEGDRRDLPQYKVVKRTCWHIVSRKHWKLVCVEELCKTLTRIAVIMAVTDLATGGHDHYTPGHT